MSAEALVCANGCGRTFVNPQGKGKHESACGRARRMASKLAEQRGTLREELIEFLMAKREPVVAQLAEIDSMIRSLQ